MYPKWVVYSTIVWLAAIDFGIDMLQVAMAHEWIVSMPTVASVVGGVLSLLIVARRIWGNNPRLTMAKPPS